MKLLSLALVLLYLQLVGTAFGKVPTLKDLTALKEANWMELSPDGEKLTYTVGGDIFLVSTKIGNGPQKLQKGSMPRWSPGGDRLAFYSSQTGDRQLWVLEARTGRTRQITSLDGRINPDPKARILGHTSDPMRFEWSPRGDQIVFGSQVDLKTPEQKEQHSDELSDSVQVLVLTPESPTASSLQGIVKLSRNLEFWRRNRSTLGCRINNLESGEGAE